MPEANVFLQIAIALLLLGNLAVIWKKLVKPTTPMKAEPPIELVKLIEAAQFAAEEAAQVGKEVRAIATEDRQLTRELRESHIRSGENGKQMVDLLKETRDCIAGLTKSIVELVTEIRVERRKQ